MKQLNFKNHMANWIILTELLQTIIVSKSCDICWLSAESNSVTLLNPSVPFIVPQKTYLTHKTLVWCAGKLHVALPCSMRNTSPFVSLYDYKAKKANILCYAHCKKHQTFPPSDIMLFCCKNSGISHILILVQYSQCSYIALNINKLLYGPSTPISHFC